MKISYNWLREMVRVDLGSQELAARLTMAGLAVDGIEPHGDDQVLEIDLTSNRPDCLSHLGVAREVAALCGVGLVMPEAPLPESGASTGDFTAVEIRDPELCPRYTARLIRGVKIGPSPDWLVRRLEALGQRSVNNIADITNYVMLEMGQPLHAFDFARLRGRRLIVRRADQGERMTTLDGEERELTPEMLVIADAEMPVAIGGIKGGEDSGISDATVDVLLEAAWFTPLQIRQTSKALGLGTEASYRFERGTDPEMVALASDRASSLIAKIAGGEVLRGLIDLYPGRDEIEAGCRPITFRATRYQKLTGLSVEIGAAERILTSLGCRVIGSGSPGELKIWPPTWRIDVRIEEDLIEEVARIAGYDLLRTSLPGSAGAGAYLVGEGDRRSTRRLLTAAGFHEAVSFSFVNAELDARYSEAKSSSRLELLDPIDANQSHLRTTLLGGLLRALEHNLNHGTRNVRLFEIGKCFFDNGSNPANPGILPTVEERPTEIERLALVATGARNERDWQEAGARFEFHDLKGVIEALADQLGLEALHYEVATDIPWLHPGRAARARLKVDGESVGSFGQLHPRLATSLKVRQSILLAEFNYQALLSSARLESRYRHLPKYPTVARDLAIVLDASIPWQSVELAIREIELPYLVDLRVFDLYRGRELPEGSHSLALSLRYRSPDRTLTDEEIAAAQEQVVTILAARFGAELR